MIWWRSKIEIFDAELETLLQPDPRTVQQHDDQPLCAGELLQDCANLVPAQHDGQPLRSTGAHNRRHGADLDRERLVEKQHRAERLVLRRGADPSLDREPRQKPRNGRRAKGRWVLLLVEHDVPTNPVDVRFLGPRAVVTRPNRMAHPIEKLRAGSHVWKRDDVRHLLSVGSL